MRIGKQSDNPAQYLLDYLEGLEDVIARHAQAIYTKRYLIYRDGYLYTGTDSFDDVRMVLNNGTGLYTYKINNASGLYPNDN